MLARYSSSSLGRFMAVDPGDDTELEDPQSWNKYVYVRNNPLVRTDPTGMINDYVLTREYEGPMHRDPQMPARTAQFSRDLATRGQALARTGAVAVGAGLATAQPEVVAAGTAMASIGGIVSAVGNGITMLSERSPDSARAVGTDLAIGAVAWGVSTTAAGPVFQAGEQAAAAFGALTDVCLDTLDQVQSEEPGAGSTSSEANPPSSTQRPLIMTTPEASGTATLNAR